MFSRQFRFIIALVMLLLVAWLAVSVSASIAPVEAASGDTYEYATLFTIGGMPFLEMANSAEQARLTSELRAAFEQSSGSDNYYGWTPFLDVLGENGFELKSMITDQSRVIFQLARVR